MADDDGWIVKGAPKKKTTPVASPKTPVGNQKLRTGDSANQRLYSSPKKYPSNSPSPNKGQYKSNKPTFENRNDTTEYQYGSEELKWTIPSDVFDKIIAKYPGLKELKYEDKISRWFLMRQMEYAHWYYTDELVKEMGLNPVPARDFFSAVLHELVKLGMQVFYSPTKYADEWQHWQKNCRVAGIALVRENPTSKEREVLMVKNIHSWFSELNTTWPTGKADLGDKTFWDQASREMMKDVGLDLQNEASKVVAVLEGKRALIFVLPIAYDDPRIQNVQPQEKEIHSAIWVPLSLDTSKVKEPAKESKENAAANNQTKEDPPELRMPWEGKENFEKLQKITSFETKQEGVEAWLERDPRIAN